MGYSAPRVSIGMPVFNGGDFIAESIESLLAQTYGDFELIISDNGSTDSTPDICRSYASRDDRIHFYRHDENRGAAWNFNHVFHLSHGDYFKWAAADDLCAPSFLASCVEVLDNDSAVIWCHPQSRHIDPQGRPLPAPHSSAVSYVGREQSHFPTRESPRADQRFRSILLGAGGTMDVFGLIRSDAMQNTSLQLPIYGGDKVFVAKLSLMGRFQEIPEVLFFKRVVPCGSGALTTAVEQQRWIDPSQSSRGIRLRLLRAYARAIDQTPLRVAERVLCYLALVRYLLQINKWWTVALKTLKGAGTGGGYIAAARSLEGQQLNRQDLNSVEKETAN